MIQHFRLFRSLRHGLISFHNNHKKEHNQALSVNFVTRSLSSSHIKYDHEAIDSNTPIGHHTIRYFNYGIKTIYTRMRYAIIIRKNWSSYHNQYSHNCENDIDSIHRVEFKINSLRYDISDNKVV